MDLLIIIMLKIKNIIDLLHWNTYCCLLKNSTVNYYFAEQIKTKTTKKIILSAKRHRQLIQLKKQLIKKQPIKTEQLYNQYHYRDVYKRINIQLESFFYERPYTLQNFNFLLHLISEQVPKDYKQRIQQIVRKMTLLNLKPDEKSYNYMIRAAGNSKDIKQVQQYFKEVSQRYLPNKFLYTSLMQAYANSDPNMALKILDEMTQKGLQPDLPTYTTLINCFRRGRKLQKCWQLHKKMSQLKIQQDQTYTSVMLKVYAATHDAQKAIKIYKQNITQKGIKPMIETINAYFKALSSRKQYSNVVVDKFLGLVERGQIVTNQTANWALRACSTVANVRSASQILKIMKLKNIQITASTLSILLKVYATACLVPHQNEKYRDIILTDSWKLLEQIDKMGGINTNVLNNMLQIYANSINSQQIDGLILPLYEKFKQPYNMYTFQILIQMYYRMNQMGTAMRIWHQMNKQIKQNQGSIIEKYGDVADLQLKINKLDENIRPTFNTLHAYLDIGIKMMDMKQVLQALDMFKKYKRLPKNQTLKFLGNLENLPEQIQTSLMDFKIQFGKARISKKKPKNVQDPQNQ